MRKKEIDSNMFKAEGKKLKEIGRGRMPCCNKSHVNRGPWSPAEDLTLTSFIQKYGHDNWRALPKQAGLLRCGKSCRLRWVNYLRPDLKRGNFTREEEETIIRLHQSIGNKWSRIAAHLPGRTDNEIKNVWNTHLKKRLAQRTAGCGEVVTKESSMISSLSSTTIESNQNYPRIEIESQINMLPHDVSAMKIGEMKSSKTSSVANQVAGLQDSEVLNKFGSIPQHSEQFIDSSGMNQLEDFTMWEDPNLLESLLNIVEDDGVLPPPNTQLDSTENTYSHELLMEPDFDLWSILNHDVIPAPAKPDDKEAGKAIVEAPMSEKSINAAQEFITDKDIDSLFESLVNEPELAQIYNEMHEKPEPYQRDDAQLIRPMAATGNDVKEMRDMGDFPMWPQSPRGKEMARGRTTCCDEELNEQRAMESSRGSDAHFLHSKIWA